MSTRSSVHAAPQEPSPSWKARVLICAQGVLAIFACLFAFPLGAVLVVANAVMAVASRGPLRKLFAGFAFAGAAAAALVALFLLPAAGSVQVGPATEL